jgi:hypothetical protein
VFGPDEIARVALNQRTARDPESPVRMNQDRIAVDGALAQDGIVAMSGLTAQIPDREWLPLAKEFFLS